MTSPRATLIASLTTLDGDDLPPLPSEVDVLEVRADLLGNGEAESPDPDRLRSQFGGRLLYTLRSRDEGGRFGGGAAARAERLVRAAEAGFDLVDLEGDRDLSAELLAAIPPERRVISWHGPAMSFEKLRKVFRRLSGTPARWYKLIPGTRQPGDELAPLKLLEALERDDVIAFATGEMGRWTRLIAPRLGAPVVYGSAGDDPAAPGQFAVERLISDYGLPDLPPVERVYGIVGRPVSHSLSPRLHNGAYRALGIPALYLPFHADSFGDFWLEVVESPSLEGSRFPLAGLSVTSPFKAAALAVAGAVSPLADRIGGANTLVRTDGVWEAESTDPDGVVGPLAEHGVPIRGRRAAVFGAGGAGRAAAAGLALAGAEVVLINRSEERGRRSAQRLGLSFQPWSEADSNLYDLVVHATPTGLDDDAVPFDPDAFSPDAVVVDMVYRDRPTALVAALRERGRTVIEGREMLLHQAFAQFRMMTGHELPPELGRELLGL